MQLKNDYIDKHINNISLTKKIVKIICRFFTILLKAIELFERLTTFSTIDVQINRFLYIYIFNICIFHIFWTIW